jgi:hypothetical protein
MVHDADADAILFPYVVVSGNVTTMLSVVNHDTAGTGQLHYAYFYKTDPDDLAEVCDEGNFWRDSTPEDIVTFDVGGIYGSATGGVLFNDPTAYGGNFDVLAPLSPTRAFLVVDNGAVNDAELYGEALLFDYALGAAWGYRAYNSLDTSALNPDFSDVQEVQGEVLNTADMAPIHLLPLTEFQTLFFVTPVGTNQDVGTMRAGIQLWDVNPINLQNLVAWNRDEEPISGMVSVDVTCVGAVTAQDMMTTLAETMLQDGGWTYVDTELGTVSDAIVFKLEYNLGGTLNGEAITGTLNTAVWLRDNASSSGAFGRRVGFGGIDGF